MFVMTRYHTADIDGHITLLASTFAPRFLLAMAIEDPCFGIPQSVL
jgi:hypothetical protein